MDWFRVIARLGPIEVLNESVTVSKIQHLSDLLPEGQVVTDPDIMSGYSRDLASLVEPGPPLAVVRPTTTDQVAEVMRWASETRTVVVPRGAGTGLSGGATALAGCVVLSLERMNQIRRIDLANQTVVAEAGVINAEVTKAVAEAGLFYPPDPGSFEVSTIGGNLATNAGGMRCVKYGVTRQSVLGLEAVLADGRILRTGGQTLKDVAGLDLTQLLIGSEGTLGVITAATLRLRPAARQVGTFVATFGSLADGAGALERIFASGVTPSMLELIDRPTANIIEDAQPRGLDREAAMLLIGQADDTDPRASVDSMVAACEAAGATMALATTDAEESEMIMATRRMVGWAVTESGPTIIEDVAVPRSRLGEMLARLEALSESSGILIATVGHAGDGNLHPTLMLPDTSPETRARALELGERVGDLALEMGGTVTGEHGIGELKRSLLHKQLDRTALEVHAAIKGALDPLGILNPGRGF